MRKLKVVQQFVASGNGGGLETEFRALCGRNSLTSQVELIPVVLEHAHSGLSPADIRFYRQAFRTANPDIIHIRGAGVESLNAAIAAKQAGRAKILVTVHGMFSDLVYYSPIKRSLCRNAVEPMIFGLADGISCVSDRAAARPVFAEYRRKMLPCVYNRMPVYPPCLPGDREQARRTLGIPAGAAVGVFTGRIVLEKGLGFLVDALRMTDRLPDNFWLLVVGSGSWLASMRSTCAALPLSARILFTGQTDDVLPFLRAADFFLSPSLHENLSVSILEACAAGLPCLVTDVGGNPEIITEGINGSLIPPRSPTAIADGIRRMCDPAYREELRRRTSEKDYSRFSDENVDLQLMSVYRALTECDK